MTLTATGFKRIRYDEYLEILETQARELFGADVNLSDRTPLGQWVKLIAFQMAEQNEALEDVYNSRYIDTATGISLDYAVAPTISRFPEDYARTAVELAVDPNVPIPKGFLVATTDNVEFATIEDAYEVGGMVKVDVVALQPGPIGNVPANTITVINTPASGVRSVTNPVAAKGGRNKETDAELRERYYNSRSKGRGASLPALRAALLELDGVVDAIVEENDTLETNAEGVPGKSIAPFIYGGEDQQIAQLLFEQKAGGIRSYGSTVVEIIDDMEMVHKIGFTRPTTIDLHVRLTLTKNGNYPLDGDQRVITNTVAYIGGVDADGKEYDGQGLGADIISFKLIAAMTDIPGIDDVVVEFSTDGGETYAEGNVVVGGKSKAQTHYSSVVIQ